jgi:LPS export ABC transporter protein LptC
MIDGLKRTKLINSKYSYLFIIILILFSCENNLEEIKKITEIPGSPEERTRDLELIYSDSGQVKVLLKAPLAESYYKPTHIIKFEEGVKIEFFNPNGSVKTILTSNYAELIQDEGNMIVKDSVIMKNVNKKQILETEELIWNQATQAVNSSKPVTVITKDGRFYGDGIKTTSDFSEYQFIKPRGTLNLN